MTSLIQIGDSQGIRIPKYLIKEAQLENAEIDLVVTPNGLLLKPMKIKKLRQGWDKPQAKEAEKETDFLDADLENIWEW